MSTSTSADGQIAQENKDDVLVAAAPAVMATGADKLWMFLAHGGLFLVGAGGGALLAWWALTFHHSNEQLWMVPVGLLLLGTPIIVWLSAFADALGSFRRLPRIASTSTAPSLVSDPER